VQPRAEGSSVVKRIKVQKGASAESVAVARAIPAVPSAPPCAQTPHTKRAGRRWADRWKPGWSYIPSSCVCPVLWLDWATIQFSVFWTLRELHWEFLRPWTGFELPSPWADLPCYGLI
jgi:hypothetical protein